METAVPLGAGSRLVLHINDKFLKDISELNATVRHARKINNRYYVGMSFDGLPEITRANIIDWVHKVESEIAETIKEEHG